VERFRRKQRRVAAAELNVMQDHSRRNRLISDEQVIGIESTEGSGEELGAGGDGGGLVAVIRRWYEWEDGSNPSYGVTVEGEAGVNYVEQDIPPYSDTQFGLHAYAIWVKLDEIQGSVLVSNYVQYCIPAEDP